MSSSTGSDVDTAGLFVIALSSCHREWWGVEGVVMDRNGVGKAFDRYLELIDACDVVDRARAELDKSVDVKSAATSVYLEAMRSLSAEDRYVLRERIGEWSDSAAGLAFLSET